MVNFVCYVYFTTNTKNLFEKSMAKGNYPVEYTL